jgi:DNA/RNA-binding domain of Phe-tRNA-synthetase-like protein
MLIKLTIDPNIISTFPDFRIAVVLGRSLYPLPDAESRLSAIRQSALSDLNANLAKQGLNEQPMLLLWSGIYRKMGLNPKRNVPTVESLARRVASGKPFPRVSALVETYLWVELRHLLPIGGYDLAKVEPPIMLRYSHGGEIFNPIGLAQVEQTSPGEIVYSDSKRVLTRHCNMKDCDHSKLTSDTKDVILMTEAPVADITSEALIALTDDLMASINHVFSGTVVTKILDAKNPLSVDL